MSEVSERKTVRLCRYFIASADMYYAEVEQRDVCASDDPEDGFRIWGEIPGSGPSTAVDLCQIFLEYAMYCRSWRRLDEALFHMKGFGERLGIALAKFLKENSPMEAATNQGACALECVLEAMNAHLTIEHVGPELRFIIAGCPLYETAERIGLGDAELAHQGINTLLQSLIHAIEPDMVLDAPTAIIPNPVFSIMMPE